MKRLIRLSNYRAQVAIIAIRIAGRSAETMAELSDALLERMKMRCRAHFSIWFIANESRLVREFETNCVRNPFRCRHSDDKAEFDAFVVNDYKGERFAKQQGWV